jgi:pyrroline-5-carboxylate reductase
VSQAFRVVFVGGGNMANALLSGIVARPLLGKVLLPTEILVIDKSETQCQKLADLYPGINTSTSIDSLIDRAELILLATKPQQLSEVCQQLSAWVRSSLVISIAAGVALSSIQSWFNGYSRIVRAMPNTPAMIGQGMTGLFASIDVADEDRRLATELMQAVGKVLWVDQESTIDAITAISGSGPAYVFYLMECLEKAALALGFDAHDANQLVKQTFLGAAMLTTQSEDGLGELREKVTSKGGTTAAGLQVLMDKHVVDILCQTAQAAHDRAVALSNEAKTV